MRNLFALTFLLSVSIGFGQNKNELDSLQKNNSSELKQQPGLALAASKIFFSEKKYSISGFGEFNYVPSQGMVDKNMGDLELYYSGLYRFATFFGYRITDKLIWNSEVQFEYIHFKQEEAHLEFVFEAFVDFLYRDYLKARIGFYPLTIGYVNNNDEPIMFHSVNRSEVERLIIPSTWIELGVMFYGNISNDWSYALGFSQGLNSEHFLSPTWIRQGREIRFDAPKSISINPQINYTGFKNVTLSLSGYYGESGQGATVLEDATETKIKGNISLTSAYAKYQKDNFSFVGIGTYGQLEDTEKIYQQTLSATGNGQVLGKEVYGYLFEFGCDVLPYLTKSKIRKENENFFFNANEQKLTLFTRYERLNTHFNIETVLENLPKSVNDLSIWTFGVNYNPKENIVLKADYQNRTNFASEGLFNSIYEIGLGFIF